MAAGTLINIHQVGVERVEYHMGPWDLVHVRGEGDVVEEAIGFIHPYLPFVKASVYTSAGLNKCVMLYILVSKLAKTMAAGFVLDNTPEIIRI